MERERGCNSSHRAFFGPPCPPPPLSPPAITWPILLVTQVGCKHLSDRNDPKTYRFIENLDVVWVLHVHSLSKQFGIWNPYCLRCWRIPMDVVLLETARISNSQPQPGCFFFFFLPILRKTVASRNQESKVEQEWKQKEPLYWRMSYLWANSEQLINWWWFWAQVSRRAEKTPNNFQCTSSLGFPTFQLQFEPSPKLVEWQSFGLQTVELCLSLDTSGLKSNSVLSVIMRPANCFCSVETRSLVVRLLLNP